MISRSKSESICFALRRDQFEDATAITTNHYMEEAVTITLDCRKK